MRNRFKFVQADKKVIQGLRKLGFTLLTFMFLSVTLRAEVNTLQSSANKILLKINVPQRKTGEKVNSHEDTSNPGIIFILSSTDTIDISAAYKSGDRIAIPNYVTDTPLGLDSQVQFDAQGDNKLRIDIVRKIGRAGTRNLFRILTDPLLKDAAGKEVYVEISGQNPEYITDIKRINALLNRNEQKLKNSSTVEFPAASAKTDLSFNKKRLKIYISKEGLYAVTGKDLESNGWDLDGVNPEYLRIYNLGKEVPIEIIKSNSSGFGRNDKIVFFGERLSDVDLSHYRPLTMYSKENVYILELSDSQGLRFAQEQGMIRSNSAEPFSYPCTKRVYDNNLIVNLRRANFVMPEDHWIYAGAINGNEKWEGSVSLQDPDVWSTSYVKFKMAVRGDAVNQNDPNPVDVYLNGRLIASGEWIGSNLSIIESSDFSPSYLDEEGKNSITVINRSSEGELSPMYVDWFEITYPRLFKAADDYLRFKAPPEYAGSMCCFTIENFSSSHILLFKKDVSRVVGGVVKSVVDSLNNKTFSLTFEDSIAYPDIEYIAATVKSLLIPDSIKSILTPVSLLANNRAPNIIIVPVDSFLTEIQRLVEHREESGIKSAVVMLDDIYNEFGYGIPGPEPIRQFLKWAYKLWSTKPATVLLAGSGTFCGRNSQADGNLIPVPIFHSIKFGACAADHFYTLLQGDDNIPEIGVGRFPVTTVEELRNVVDKTIDYGNTPPQPWQNRYCMIAAGGHGNVFLSQTEEFIFQDISPCLSPIRLYLNAGMGASYVGTTENLVSYINNGLSYLNFRGHGGGAVWSDGGMFTLEHVPLLENKGRYPFVTSMTCFTGDFSATRESLGESMLISKDKGSAGFWGATGVGWILNDYYLLTEFLRVMRTEPDLCVGEMIKEAKRNYLKSFGGSIARSDAYQYTLLGDPCLKLVSPADTADVVLQKRAVSDSLTVTGNSAGSQSIVNIEIAGEDLQSSASYDYTFTNNKWKVTIPVPDSLKSVSESGGVRIWQKSVKPEKIEHVYIPFSLSESYFDSLETEPSSIRPGLKFRISVLADSDEPIDSMWCRIIHPSADVSLMQRMNGRRFITKKKFGPYDADSNITLNFYYLTEQKKKVESVNYNIHIPGKPDLSVRGVELTGSDGVYLSSLIANTGSSDVDSAIVKFTCSELSFTGFDTIAVGKDTFSRAQAAFSPVPGNLNISVTVEPGCAVQEINGENNTSDYVLVPSIFNVTDKSGTAAGLLTDTVGVEGIGYCFVPPGSGIEDGCIKISKSADPVLYQQNGVDITFTKDIHCTGTVILPILSEYEHPALYRWSEPSKRWVICNSTVKRSTIMGEVSLPGSFTVMEKSDDNPPNIEIQVQGQPFASGSYVARNPIITILIEDSSGVNINPEKIEIYLDDLSAARSEIFMSDSLEDPRSFTVLYRPDLDDGEHYLVVKAEDVNGNTIKTEPVKLLVSSRFEIRFLGNHPNPFSPLKEKTVFTYILTGPAERVMLKIFTVSGRLVRKFEDYLMGGADYHEIEWDGTDMQGEKLANGVYFFMIEAESGGKKDVVRGKIAIIQ